MRSQSWGGETLFLRQERVRGQAGSPAQVCLRKPSRRALGVPKSEKPRVHTQWSAESYGP